MLSLRKNNALNDSKFLGFGGYSSWSNSWSSKKDTLDPFKRDPHDPFGSKTPSNDYMRRSQKKYLETDQKEDMIEGGSFKVEWILDVEYDGRTYKNIDEVEKLIYEKPEIVAGGVEWKFVKQPLVDEKRDDGTTGEYNISGEIGVEGDWEFIRFMVHAGFTTPDHSVKSDYEYSGEFESNYYGKKMYRLLFKNVNDSWFTRSNRTISSRFNIY